MHHVDKPNLTAQAKVQIVPCGRGEISTLNISSGRSILVRLMPRRDERWTELKWFSQMGSQMIDCSTNSECRRNIAILMYDKFPSILNQMVDYAHHLGTMLWLSDHH